MRVRKIVTVDENVWENAKKIIQTEAGMSMSKYIEITLRGLPRAVSGTTQEFVQGAIMDFVAADKSLSGSERKKIEGAIKGEDKVKVKKKKA
jgi:hypothetical protein